MSFKNITKTFSSISSSKLSIFCIPIQIAAETGSSVEEVREEACGILEEMSQNLQLKCIRLMGFTLSKVLKRLYSGIFVNMEGLNMVRLLINTEFRTTERYLIMWVINVNLKAHLLYLVFLPLFPSKYNHFKPLFKCWFNISLLSLCSFNNPFRSIQ